tara:strand:- start:2929 stop:3297 length:369 start_codon:yes stop_codon:yes gene_type:complete
MSENLENYFYDPEDDDLEILTDKQRASIKRQSMENTYTLVINNYDFDIFPEKLFWLLTDFDSLTIFDVLMDYYIETEEYEKCAILKIVKEKHTQISRESKKKMGKFTYKLPIEDDETDSPTK